jgi:hypothetical protein
VRGGAFGAGHPHPEQPGAAGRVEGPGLGLSKPARDRADIRQGPFDTRPAAAAQAEADGRAASLLTAVVVALALSLAACGKVGAPKPPQGAGGSYPQAYPPPDSVVPGGAAEVPPPRAVRDDRDRGVLEQLQ